MNLKEVKFFASSVKIVTYFAFNGYYFFQCIYKDKCLQCGYDIRTYKDDINNKNKNADDFNHYVSWEPISGMTTEEQIKIKETLCEMIKLFTKNKSLVRRKYRV